MSYIEKEKLIKADITSIENRVRHAFNQGYDLGYKEGKERAKPQEQEPRKGHWTTVLHEEILFCSECHQRLVDEQTYIPLHYCPNCGAKMAETEDA